MLVGQTDRFTRVRSRSPPTSLKTDRYARHTLHTGDSRAIHRRTLLRCTVPYGAGAPPKSGEGEACVPAGAGGGEAREASGEAAAGSALNCVCVCSVPQRVRGLVARGAREG